MTAGSVRASDFDRDQVVELLHAAYAEGRITIEEHSERTELALHARTFEDLTALTDDLLPARITVDTPAAHRPVPLGNATDAEPERITAVLSEVKRVGPWRVRQRYLANVFMGSVHLDLTEAVFDSPVIEVTGTQVVGSVFLRVRPGTVVRDEVTNVLGETSIKNVGEPDPAQPIVVLKLINIMGEVKVRGPKKPFLRKRVVT